MEFRVLGTLDVVRDATSVTFGSFKQRALLGLLLVHANEVVAIDRIIDDLWGSDAGLDRQNALWVHISNLRSTLEPDRARRSGGSYVLTRSPGYMLRIGPGELDAARFEQLVREARGLVEVDPSAASLVLGEALASWRGRAYEDLGYESFAQHEIARLEELRLEAVELRIDADLRRGQSSALIAELEGLVRLHPLRERFIEDLMVALCRSGRHADALRACGRLRAQLGDELGVEPSSALRSLEARIICGDPTLDHPGDETGGPAPLAVRGYELREPLGDAGACRAYQPAVGREVAIKVSRPEQANDPAFIRRFEAEAAVVARLVHPHVVPVYDYWREPDAAYLVTRLFPRGSLADLLDTGPLAPSRLAPILADVGSALAFAHERGVVHGSVCPRHILLDDDDRAYLSGFSIGEADRSGASPYSPPEQDAGAAPTASADLFGLAVVLVEALSGRRAGEPRAGIDEMAPALAAVVRRATSAHPSDRQGDVTTFVREALASLGSFTALVTTIPIENPYRGLRAFDEADAADFFGREPLVERIVRRLSVGDTASRFLCVVGPSGSGKSSVVRAGVLPALRRGAIPGSAEWFMATMTPGPRPFEALEAALVRVAAQPPGSLLELLTSPDDGIQTAVHHVLPDDGSSLLLTIDQLEELYSQAPEEDTNAFLDALAAAVRDVASRLHVVATLRADFYDRPLRHLAIGELVRLGTEVITPMSPDEIERAITGPAERRGVHFAPGLVPVVVADVADRVGALPLMQYSLTELFDRREDGVLGLDAYRSIGGVSGALARRAESIVDDLPADAQEMARHVLLRLVTLGEGGPDLRRRVPLHELTDVGDTAARLAIDTFAGHGLLTFDRDAVTRSPTVEIAHEALLTTWGRLRVWIDTARDDVRHQRRLAAAAAEWEDAGRAPGYLLSGPALDEQVMWRAMTDLRLHPSEQAFLDASVERRASEILADSERTHREDRLRRATRRRSRLLLVSGVVLAAVIALAAVAVAQRQNAQVVSETLAVTAQARRLSAAAGNLAAGDPQLGLLLALQALDTSENSGRAALPESVEALHWAIQAAHVPYPATASNVTAGSGPNGRTGLFEIPLSQLVELARGRLERTFTADECERFAISSCPTSGADLAHPPDGRSVAVPREAPAPTPVEPVAKPLLNTELTVWGPISSSGGLDEEFRRVAAETGIQVTYRMPATFEHDLLDAIASGDTPDLALVSQPALVHELGDQGAAMDLGRYLDPAKTRREFGDAVVDLTTTPAGLFGIPVEISLKGLVWYPVPEFEQAGYRVPATWDELVALSRRIAADGRTPWCMGMANNEASGWIGTDWIEALLLRSAGTDAYDRWVSHDIPFDDPAVEHAAELFGEIAFGDGFVRGGPSLITRTGIDVAPEPLFSQPPDCWLYFQASFQANYLPAGVSAGNDVNAFLLPPMDARGAAPAFGGGEFLVAFSDRPEVRALVRAVADPSWGEFWAASPNSQFLPANADFNTNKCGNWDSIDVASIEPRRHLCTLAHEAIAEGLWRFDASDQMPPEIGSVTEDARPGAFYQGVLDYLDRGLPSLRAILASIEEAWRR